MSRIQFVCPLTWPLAALVCLVLAPAARAQDVSPSITKDPVAYLHFLETSADPTTVAVRQQIEAGPADLARAREAAVKEGIPLTPDALQKPLPPEGENAAPLYQKLFQLLRDKPLHLPAYAQPLVSDHTYTPEQLAVVQKIYDSRQDVWDLVHQAADKPQCVFVRDWKQGAGILFPEYQKIREAARLLNTESYLLAAQGKYSDAVKNQARGFRVAEHAASDPVLISYLVGVACDAITLRGMQNVLILAGPNADVDAQVARAVTGGRPRLSLRYALGGEIASFQDVTFLQLRAQTQRGGVPALVSLASADFGLSKVPPVSGPTTPVDVTFALDWLDASQALTLSHMRVLVAASDLPPLPQSRVFTQEAQAQVAQPKTALTVLSDELLPAYDRIDQQETRRQANESVTLASADVLGAWTKDGTFPSALPRAMTDPFTGRPLGYRREGDDGFVVYSAGPDGTFGGGKPGDARNDRQIKFRYPAAATPIPPYMLE